MAFSTTEKLAVAGAFLALVTMAVGTEDEPGLVAVTQADAGALRISPPVEAAPTPQQAAAQSTWWPGLPRKRDAAAEDRAGSAKVEQAPEPPPKNF